MKTRFLVAVVIMNVLSVASFGQNAPALRKKQFNLNNDIAISGYDPVAYFKVNKAVKGKKEFIVNQDGVYYLFASAENKEEFKKNPSQYEPQYGGWCAYAMGAKGQKVAVDPETFKIIDGKLYLFYNSNFNNTLKIWNKDETGLKTKADTNWKNIFH
ncbi:MAG: YHS domain-containing (seleno)protein [Bacteroidota bacterium]|nr:YHS domain-containing (seleno)protein [Bacteroidota bacterium]